MLTSILLAAAAAQGGGCDPCPIPIGPNGAQIQHFLLQTDHESHGLALCYDGTIDGDGTSGAHGENTTPFLKEPNTSKPPDVYLTDYGGTNGDWTLEWVLRTAPDEFEWSDPWTYYEWDYTTTYPKTGCPHWITLGAGPPQFSELEPDGLLYIEIVDGNNQLHQHFIDLDPPGAPPHDYYEWYFTTPQYPSGVLSFSCELYLYETRSWGYEWWAWDDDCFGPTPNVCSDATPGIRWDYYKHLELTCTQLLPPS